MSLKNFRPFDVGCILGSDPHLKKLFSFLDCPDSLQDRLAAWVKKLPFWNELANEAARPEKLPRLEKYDRAGNPREKIILPLETQLIRRDVVESGIFINESEIEKFAKVYLLATLGESGVTCPLACTDGLIRVLEALGSDDLKKKYLPKLLSKETPLAGAQFVTEQSGGSDVGAIEARALLQVDGTWHIHAEKWYCSVADEYFLVLARPEGAQEGTKGLAIFFVPRVLEKNDMSTINSLSYKKLKNKLGTQSLPTAEIDFNGSTGFLIGKAEDGFHNLMNYILNVSRIHNAANALGILHRAYAEAQNYATQRVAFGKPIVEYPLIQASLLKLKSHLVSKRALYFSMLGLVDRHGLVPQNREQGYWQRFLVNLIKYRTSVTLTDDVKESILVFGANGIVEDFSILPRLFRDSIILETWEGAHNVLCLQILRDTSRFDFWPRFQNEAEDILKTWPSEKSPTSREVFQGILLSLKGVFETGQNLNEPAVQKNARDWVDRMGILLEAGALVRQWWKQQTTELEPLIEHLLQQTRSHEALNKNRVTAS